MFDGRMIHSGTNSPSGQVPTEYM